MVIKKKNFEIELPILNSIVDVQAVAISALNGKTIKLDLTRMLKGKSIEATFLISVSDNKAAGAVKRLILLPFYIRRAMRGGISYVEDSFVCEARDCKLRVKPFLITRKKVHRSIRNNLRINTQKYITEFCKDKTCAICISAKGAFSKIKKDLSPKLL